MKKSTVVIIVAVILLILIAIAGISSYNRFVKAEENVEAAKSQVSVMLERRADLIPNFVATVSAYSEYEKSTITAVTEARASVGKANTVGELDKAQEQLDKAINVWVNAVTESYPDLKANAQYVALQDELAGSENRIAAARKDYNDTAREYNSSIRTFPASIVAGICGFEKAPYFELKDGSGEVPKVDFSK